MTAIIDEKEFKRDTRKDSVLPEQNAKLRVSGNRWFIVCVLLALGQMGQVAFSKYAFDKANNNKELVYIKLFPDGRSYVGEFVPQDEQLFFRSTIDAALERFLKARYGQQPETIKQDYYEAGIFMSEPLYGNFVSTQAGGFNAAQKAADVMANTKTADRVEIKWGFADHYDKIPAIFNKEAGEVVKSNIYFTSTTRNGQGVIKPNGIKKSILRVQWRLLPKKEMAEHKLEWLRINPIGVEIVDNDVIDDPAAYNSKEDKPQ
jgi:hypothetical protein